MRECDKVAIAKPLEKSKPSMNAVNATPLLSYDLKNLSKLSKNKEVISLTSPFNVSKDITFKGNTSNIETKIPIMIAPFNLKYGNTVITIEPNKHIIAQHAAPPNFKSLSVLNVTKETYVY